MAGVTHFERRGQVKHAHRSCGLCGKTIKATPRMLSTPEKREGWREDWAKHLRDHVMNPADGAQPLEDKIMTAIRAAYNVQDELLRNL